MRKPKILKKVGGKELQESGCCFRSCGGMPCITQYHQKSTKVEKKLAKI